MNLIIIDDDPFVTGALKILLEANPNITVLASGSNGKEAVIPLPPASAGHFADGYSNGRNGRTDCF